MSEERAFLLGFSGQSDFVNSYTLPGTDWNISRLAYGCMGIGGQWNDQPLTAEEKKSAFAALDAAFESGMNFYDHADIYTLGKSERVFAEYLAANPDLRQGIFIQSKCGIIFPDRPAKGDPGRYDFSYDHLISSVEGILQRLNVEYLDVLLLHRPDALIEPEEVARAFDALEEAGKVRHFGVSNHSVLQMELLKKFIRQPLVANQLQLSLVQPALITEGIYVNQDRGLPVALATGVLDYCRLNDIMVQAWSPVGGGGFYKAVAAGEVHPRQKLIDALAALSREKGCEPEAIMLAWLLRHPAGIQPVIGSIRPERIRAAAAADSVELTRKEWYTLLSASQGRNVP